MILLDLVPVLVPVLEDSIERWILDLDSGLNYSGFESVRMSRGEYGIYNKICRIIEREMEKAMNMMRVEENVRKEAIADGQTDTKTDRLADRRRDRQTENERKEAIADGQTDTKTDR